jgi:replicative DNA helicase
MKLKEKQESQRYSNQTVSSSLRDMRLPPQNIEAERALLGSILIRPDAMGDISDIISPDSFYLSKHHLIYETMLELLMQGAPIDVLTLSTRLKELNQLEKVGDTEYLIDLSHAVPSAANIVYYAEIVQKKHLARSLIDAANDISGYGYEEAEAVEDLLDRSEKRIFEVSNMLGSSEYVVIGREIKSAFDRYEKFHESDAKTRGIPTGFTALDNLLSGLQRSDLIILAARPSMGKTSLALDIARQSAKLGSSVLIFSLEMASQQLVDRMISAESRVDAWKLRTASIQRDSDFRAITDAAGRLAPLRLFIDDKPGNTVLGMRSTARRIKRESGLDLIVIDYLQLMLPSGRFKNSDSMVHQITEISRSLKILAREMDCPVLALSQLSRAVEQRGGKPRLSDLRDSGSIEQDADIVAFIHSDNVHRHERDNDAPIVTEIIVEKHRNGPVGKVDLHFDARRASFMNIEHNDYENIVASLHSKTDEVFDPF